MAHLNNLPGPWGFAGTIDRNSKKGNWGIQEIARHRMDGLNHGRSQDFFRGGTLFQKIFQKNFQNIFKNVFENFK